MHPASGQSRGALAFPLLIFLTLLLLSFPATLWAIGHPFAVKEINPGGNAIDPYLINPFATIGGRILFAANDGTSGTELWVSDGSASGTALLKEINPGTAGSSPQLLTPLIGKVIFRATEPATGTELWVSDGTAAGTQLLADIYPGTAGSTPQKFAQAGNVLYFVASTATGNQLWKTDGTPAGTTVATEFTPTTYSYIDSVTADNGKLLVVTCTSSMTISWDLWRVDPVTGTTVRVTTLLRQPKNVTSCGGKMFFSLVSGTYGDELWLTDGTESGTTLVKDIDPAGSSTPSQLLCLDSTLYFRASEPTTGIELWKSDGTPSGTLLVKDINPGAASSYPWGLKAFNGRLLLQASDGTTGGELWISDGSTAGTVLVKDINPGSGGYVTTDDLAVAGTLAIFSAIDGVHGDEVWVTDGTSATTFLLADLQPGSSYSSPGNFTVSGSTLFFSAYDQNTHYTLFAAQLTPAPHSLITSPLTGTVVSSPSLSLSGEAHSDTGSPVSLVEVSVDGGNTYQPATGTAVWSFTATLPADGIYTIRARATDRVGTQELPFPAESIQVTLDSAPPSGFVRINSGAETTASTQVTLEVTASAVDPGVTCTYVTPPYICGTLSARYSNSGTSWSAWEAASAHKSWSLLTGDGAKTVYVELKDRAGNTASINATITLDTSQVPSSTISSPATGFATSGSSVAVSGTAAPGPGGDPVTLVEVSANGGSTWQAASGTTAWNITLALPTTGTYTIKSRASTGSLQEPPAAGITVTVDRTPPSGTLTFYYGEWTLNATDGGICVLVYPYICGAIDMSLNGTSWLPATTRPGTGGPLWLRDKAGNASYLAGGSYASTVGGPIQLPHATPVYYSLLQHAYDAALDGDLIKLTAGLTENLTLARGTTVTIRGGYDSGFTAATGTTPLSGSLTVQAGAAALENMTVQGTMTISAGEVTANGLSLL